MIAGIGDFVDWIDAVDRVWDFVDEIDINDVIEVTKVNAVTKVNGVTKVNAVTKVSTVISVNMVIIALSHKFLSQLPAESLVQHSHLVVQPRVQLPGGPDKVRQERKTLRQRIPQRGGRFGIEHSDQFQRTIPTAPGIVDHFLVHRLAEVFAEQSRLRGQRRCSKRGANRRKGNVRAHSSEFFQ